jgi:hypothetical protein
MSQLNCNVGMKNLGVPCVPLMKVQKKFFFQQKYDSTGVQNEIDLTAGPFNKAFFDAMINHVDPSKRLYPLPEVKNVSDERADPMYDSADDGTQFFVENGIRTVSSYIFASEATPQLLGLINDNRGVPIQIYSIDKESNLIGKVGSSATKFTGIEIESDTLNAILVKSQDKTIQKLKLNFNIAIGENDADLRMIQRSELAYDLSSARALIDVTSVITNISVDGFTVKLVTNGGTPITPVLCKGLVTADFVSSVTAATSKVRNETDGADVTVTVVESPLGVYEVTYSVAQTVGDIIILKPLKAGYDFSAVEAATITVAA